MIRHVSYNEIECDRCGFTLSPIWESMTELKTWLYAAVALERGGFAEHHYCPDCAKAPTRNADVKDSRTAASPPLEDKG